jgi:hypothetical protein
MVLNEAPSEKFQHAWYSRLAHERHDFSTEVEKALVDTPLRESFWSDDQSWYATVGGTGKGNQVFPPRLSLQSRFLPGTPVCVGTGLINAPTNTEQHTNIWTRFVKRLRSSLSAFRGRSAVADGPALPPISNENKAVQSLPVEDMSCPVRRASNPDDSRIMSTTHEVSSKSERRVATVTNVRHGASRSTQGRQRLAGRATRVRLEVVSPPSSGSIPNKDRMTVPDSASCANDGATSVCLPAIGKATRRSAEERSVVDGDGGTTSLRIPAIRKVARQSAEDHTFANSGRGTSSMRLPVVERVTKQSVEDSAFTEGDRVTSSMRLPTVEKIAGRREEPSPAQRAGTSMFECGQRDVMISDPSVAASSVVLVVLTANPGPVVVQYVSLQPRIGFTVHLTAPAAMGVPFNYVVL